MKLRWTEGRPGGKKGSWVWEHLMFWDLVDDEADPKWYPEGMAMGWIRRERRAGEPDVFKPYPNGPDPHLPTTATLKEAQDSLIAWVIAQELDNLES